MVPGLFAAVVVKRAIRLAELDKPEDAFRTPYHWKSGNHMRTIRGWDHMLTGFEIIVASSNNGPVENISKEIPGRDAIDCEDASYYPELATTVLNCDNDPAQKIAAWGMVAAPLGKKPNRIKFANAFWYGDERAGIKGFHHTLKGYQRPPPSGWPTAVQAFRAALRDEQDLRAERAVVYQVKTRLPTVRENIEALGVQQSAAESRSSQIRAELRAARDRLAQDARAAAKAKEAAAAHRLRRPSFLASLLGLGSTARGWRAANCEIIRPREIASRIPRCSRRHRARRSGQGGRRSPVHPRREPGHAAQSSGPRNVPTWSTSRPAAHAAVSTSSATTPRGPSTATSTPCPAT